MAKDTQAERAFRPAGEKYFADIYQLARQRLASVGVEQIFGGDRCTLSEKDDFLLSSRQDDGSYGKFHLADITSRTKTIQKANLFLHSSGL